MIEECQHKPVLMIKRESSWKLAIVTGSLRILLFFSPFETSLWACVCPWNHWDIFPVRKELLSCSHSWKMPLALLEGSVLLVAESVAVNHISAIYFITFLPWQRICLQIFTLQLSKSTYEHWVSSWPLDKSPVFTVATCLLIADYFFFFFNATCFPFCDHHLFATWGTLCLHPCDQWSRISMQNAVSSVPR